MRIHWKIAAVTVVAAIAAFGVAKAPAAGTKPPKSLSLDWNSYSDFDMLQIKSTGSMTTSAGKVTFYAISGYAFNGSTNQVHGGGYMAGTVFRGTFDGLNSTGNLVAHRFSFDVVAGTGSI